MESENIISFVICIVVRRLKAIVGAGTIPDPQASANIRRLVVDWINNPEQYYKAGNELFG